MIWELFGYLQVVATYIVKIKVIVIKVVTNCITVFDLEIASGTN